MGDGGVCRPRSLTGTAPTPYRRPRDAGELPAWQHDLNTVHERVRIRVEHVFAHMK